MKRAFSAILVVGVVLGGLLAFAKLADVAPPLSIVPAGECVDLVELDSLLAMSEFVDSVSARTGRGRVRALADSVNRANGCP